MVKSFLESRLDSKNLKLHPKTPQHKNKTAEVFLSQKDNAESNTLSPQLLAYRGDNAFGYFYQSTTLVQGVYHRAPPH